MTVVERAHLSVPHTQEGWLFVDMITPLALFVG